MEPNARIKPRKGGRGSERPFYAVEGPTSADIVAEARSSVRTLDTTRPFTPVDLKRTLFGSGCAKLSEGRPPSAFSLGHYQYEGETSRPPSGRRLTPIERAPEFAIDALMPSPPSAAAGKGCRPLRKSISGPPDRERVDVQDLPIAPLAHTPGIVPVTRAFGLEDGDKRVSPINSPPISADKLQRSSVGPLPAPPVMIKADKVAPRRVRSGPKERIGAIVDDAAWVRSGPPQRSLVDSQMMSGLEEETSKSERSKKGERTAGEERRKKKPHSAGERPAKDELTLYYEEQVKPVLSQMEKKFINRNVAELCQDCLRLWHVLDKKSMIGKAGGSSSSRRRGEILRTVFKFLDINEPRILLRLSRLILSMKVTGNNLTNVCMVVYRVAKAEKNDEIFMEEDLLRCIVDAVQSSSVESHCDALLYSAGALKHLSNNNPVAQKEVVSLGGVQALAQVMNSICKEMLSDKQSLQVAGLLVQVTGALRNLADVNGAREIFVSSGVVKNLALVLGPYSKDSELVWNVSRALSKLTLYTECCNALSTTENCFGALLKILKEYETKQEIVVRVCFILGNLTSKNDVARYNLGIEVSCTEILLSVMQTYFNLEMECMKNEVVEQVIGENKGLSKNEDVLIKAIRVIANLCIYADAGPVLASNNHLVSLLVQILDVKEVASSEELVLNTVATLNNLSFYGEPDSAVFQKQLDITQLLISLLLPENMDAMVEASRVFGNFSRFREVRALLAEHKVDEIMIALLDAGDRETVFTACGVLINLMTDADIRPKLKEEEGVKKLIDVLRDFGRNDWHLAAMVCQILWNYSDSITNSSITFGEQETTELIELLVEYLDEETALDRSELEGLDPNLTCALRDMWESQFVPVGDHLLRRVRTNHTDLVPLEAPS